MRRLLSVLLPVILLVVAGCGGGDEKKLGEPISGLPEYLPRSMDFHIFYYAWYGTPEFDGEYRHWNHAVLNPDGSESGVSYPGGDDIGSNFYPRSGCYSSNDPETIARHCFEIRLAGAGVICVSWWGKGSFSDKAVPGILDAALRHGLKVDFHIEPFEGRTAATTREAIAYIIDSYGGHPAFYRTDRFGIKPMFFIYDSYLIDAEDWKTVLSPGGKNSIRGTRYDSNVIGLLVDEKHLDFILDGGFDGCYTYFAIDGFTWGSTTRNWADISEWSLDNGKIFIPCIGPGYDDTRIRPWNAVNTRDRDRGEYYYAMFVETHKIQPPFIGITSFNEWHEGTQIESATPKSIEGFTYLDYRPMPHDFYLHKTRSLFSNYKYTFSH
jgi:glycoprotein endo-alpha-1,2-mannosidase